MRGFLLIRMFINRANKEIYSNFIDKQYYYYYYYFSNKRTKLRVIDYCMFQVSTFLVFFEFDCVNV